LNGSPGSKALINKVNRPTHLTLVKGSKASDHDLGGSSGSGVAYEKHADQKPHPEKNAQDLKKSEDGNDTEHSGAPHFVEQIGMTEVVRDLLEQAHATQEKATGNRAGLTTKYASDGGTAKGLLLNKKAE
jgi:hypothetical protein